jgi:hypothetical protein
VLEVTLLNYSMAKEFAVKLGHIHENPVKRGWVRAAEDWKWSSFRHYAFGEVGVLEIESEWTARDREGRRLDVRMTHHGVVETESMVGGTKSVTRK